MYVNKKTKFIVLLIVFFGVFGLSPHQFSHIKFRAKFILFILFIIIGVGMYAKSSRAATINAASCNYSDVQSAVDSAESEDIVNVPAGNCTWKNVLLISKPITLQGAGKENTIITGNVSNATDGVISFEYTGSTSASSRLTGVTIDNTGYSAPALTLAVDYTKSTQGWIIENIRIDNNALKGNTSANPAIVVYGIVSGVVDNNTIVGRTSIENGGQTVSFDMLAPTATFGTKDNLYFEDNTVTSSTLPISSGHGSRWAARYNTFFVTRTESAPAVFDSHGNMVTQTTTNIIMEAYGNHVTPTSDENIMLCFHRGGIALNFFNYVTKYNVLNQIWEEWDDGAANPASHIYLNANSGSSSFTLSSPLPSDAGTNMNIYILNGSGEGEYYQITGGAGTTNGSIFPNKWINNINGAEAFIYYDTGPKSKSSRIQKVHNTYIWGNRKGNNRLVTTTISMDYFYQGDTPINDIYNNPPEIMENREFWQDAISFDGTSGVGCGTLSNRPTTCTTGVGYWATNQSCTDLTGMVGAHPNTPISGTLYKCTGTNNWEAYYTPYTYPHPLRNESGDDTTPPASPTGLNVQ